MAGWQLALLLLVAAWALQSVGVWWQMQRYSTAVRGVRRDYADGFLGTGFVKGRLGKGTIALVVASDDLTVRRVSTMTGRSVFAGFRDHPEFEGTRLDRLERTLDEGGRLAAGEKTAVLQAVAQIEDRRNRTRETEEEEVTGDILSTQHP